MQNARFCARESLDAGQALALMMTISPGCNIADELRVDQIKRRRLAGEHPAAVRRLPMESGRKPCGSRAPINSFSVMMTSEYAPSMRRRVWTRVFATPPICGCASIMMMISLSTVV
jgi:hypothetical protein